MQRQQRSLDITISSYSSSVCDALAWNQKNSAPDGAAAGRGDGFPANNKKKEAEDKKGSKVYLYIVMQLCQRESLKSWLRSCTYQRVRTQSLKMFREICSGVEYVHSQGLIHRDLKPGNIFFSADGTIKVRGHP